MRRQRLGTRSGSKRLLLMLLHKQLLIQCECTALIAVLSLCGPNSASDWRSCSELFPRETPGQMTVPFGFSTRSS